MMILSGSILELCSRWLLLHGCRLIESHGMKPCLPQPLIPDEASYWLDSRRSNVCTVCEAGTGYERRDGSKGVLMVQEEW